MAKFGKRLREIRVAAGIKLKDLADQMEWTAVYVSDIELGRRNPPSPDKIRQIALILKADSDELLNLADQEKKKVVLDLVNESPGRMEVALMLARSWDGLSDEQIEQMKSILNRRASIQNE